MARAYLADVSDSAAGSGGTTVSDHYQLVVHVDEKALHGGVGRSDLPLATVRRLACDGNLIPLIEDDCGRPLALGRKRRVVSPALRKALRSRDGGCTFPGCHRSHYVDAHHLEHWTHGGRTEPDNLTLLCSYHHRLLHEGGFSIRKRHDGELDFRRADGRTIPRSGYRREDMADPSMEGSCSDGVRESGVVYTCMSCGLSRQRESSIRLYLQ